MLKPMSKLSLTPKEMEDDLDELILIEQALQTAGQDGSQAQTFEYYQRKLACFHEKYHVPGEIALKLYPPVGPIIQAIRTMITEAIKAERN